MSNLLDDFVVVGGHVVQLAPLYCGNLECPETVKHDRRQVISQGEPGHLVRGKCPKCRQYTLGRVG